MNGKTILAPNRFFLLLLMLALFAGLATFEVSAQAGTLAAVNTGRLNVRTGPSIAYPAITSIPYNTEVILLGRATGTTWVQIRLANLQVGWVNFLYLRSYATLNSLPITWTTPVPPTSPGVPPPNTPRYHTVAPGETLQIIAARYGTTWQNLAALNNLANPNYIFVGQQLLVSGTAPTTPTTPTYPPTNTGVHIVQPGETLRSIADRYGTTWAALASANNLPNANYIYVGQRLVIPAGPPPAPRYYTVQQGDGIYAIARRFGVSPQNIILANNLWNANLIYPGQVLIIP